MYNYERVVETTKAASTCREQASMLHVPVTEMECANKIRFRYDFNRMHY